MSLRLVRAALEGRLAAWASARTPALAITWENAKAGATAPYLRAFLLPANTTSDTLDGAHRAYRGVFQVNVVAPVDAGPGWADGIADEIAALFPVNLRLPSGSLTVQVTTPASAAPALQRDTDYTVPVSLTYRADTT